MNYEEVNLDLQSVKKRIYQSLIYKSSFYKFLNEKYIGEIRNTGTPMIEVIKSDDVEVNVRETKEIANALTPSLMGYSSVKVDLTALPMDYSIRIPVLVAGTGIANVLEDAMEKKDSAVAKQIDTYGFGMLADEVSEEFLWTEDYIANLTTLSAMLFNNGVYEGYRCGLSATEYGKYVASLTSVLKYETMAGVEGVDRGIVARAYGVDTFQIADTYLDEAVGYFFNSIAVVGDTFFDAFVQHNSPQGWPGYYVLEGNILFGAKVVEGNAIVKLVEELSA